MVSDSQKITTSESGYASATTLKPDFLRQSSFKRRNSDSNDQDTFEEISSKRGRSVQNELIPCPIAQFGCIPELPFHNLLEHYCSEIHQKTLLKAVEVYVRQLHDKPCDPQLNLDKTNYLEILDTINILAEGLSCLHDDNAQIQTNFVQLLSNTKEQQRQIEELKKSIDENSQLLQASQLSTNILQNEIETMNQTLIDTSNLASHDGSYLWKISNVAEKIKNATSDHQTSIYSPPFYSSPTGYKMCMRLYLNGDGNARRTHLSLFFVLMRGEYDAILTWPFGYKITFSLHDQTISRRHIIDSFRPDVKSNSFQRPKSNMNIASGIPKFLPLSVIQQENNPYLVDDCMFIRCIVDFAAMPKMMIPYMVNLNPGLPIVIQQNMIQSEIQKHRTVEATSMESSMKIDDSKVNSVK